jgi:hypothetical protein
MLTKSQAGGHNRIRGPRTAVRPNSLPKTTAYEALEALAAAEYETGARRRSAWHSAVTALCLLWFCINAIPASAHVDLHVWLNLIAAVVLAFSGVWSGPNQSAWSPKQIAWLPEETNREVTRKGSPLRRRLPSRSLKPTS